MASPSYSRSLMSLTKRLKLSPEAQALNSTSTPLRTPKNTTRPALSQRRYQSTSSAAVTPTTAQDQPPIDAATAEKELQRIRLPRAVQATYLDPLRHRSKYGIKTCELQMRSYSVRNLEVFADFAMRAAYYLKLAASGPRPLPKITERWTMPRSNFVHKKSQENFERITVRRQIEINDGHPETVAIWLAYLKRHQYYGIGMKANVFEHSGLEVAQDLDAEAERIAEKLGEKLQLVGGKKSFIESDEDAVQRKLEVEPFKAQWGAYAAMGGAQSAPGGSDRFETQKVTSGSA